jgi:hypothetical protein
VHDDNFLFCFDNDFDDVNDVVGGLRGGRGGGGFRVLACADTGSETPLGVRQYSV